MVRPRNTIAGIMVTAAVIAFDCFALIRTGGAGVLVVGLTLTLGFGCFWRAKGSRFWLGFEVAGLVAVLSYLGYVEVYGWTGIVLWVQILANFVPWTPLLDYSPRIAALFFFEIAYGLPMLLIAWIGGLLATLIPWGAPNARTHRVRSMIYRLTEAVVALALILGWAVAALRWQAPHQTIRVYNKTSTPLHIFQLEYTDLRAQQTIGTALASTIFSPSAVEPGEIVCFEIKLPGHTGFSLSYTTPDGTVMTREAMVNVAGDIPSYLDLYVEPDKLRAHVAPRAR